MIILVFSRLSKILSSTLLDIVVPSLLWIQSNNLLHVFIPDPKHLSAYLYLLAEISDTLLFVSMSFSNSSKATLIAISIISSIFPPSKNLFAPNVNQPGIPSKRSTNLSTTELLALRPTSWKPLVRNSLLISLLNLSSVTE
ncbi:hypothetical protein Saci_1081 [Sulfolobus acidocaldarius DSM 639]|uniref:Uncharacterized protein n=1 Tax=Sulfolobus acidocaldarius (strain ATCC 33909 / DSM 639 / JCM 8929 / NBRC 15157 / NCIMB 11770) TaxID=330779 RepID=Q4J9U2_SULAC|nr:hypothetical protein Saci_1081 [Sulfolobus acidocaldarius DSM 639]